MQPLRLTMAHDNHSYYLQQLGLPHWTLKSTQALPIKTCLMAKSILTIIVNIEVKESMGLEQFILAVLQAINLPEPQISYLLYTQLKPLDYSVLTSSLTYHKQKIMLIGGESFINDFNNSVKNLPPEQCICIPEEYSLYSKEAKKEIMNRLLLNDLL